MILQGKLTLCYPRHPQVHLNSTHFQSPKHVIKAKDPQVTRIDVEVEGFIASLSPKRTLQVELIAQQVAYLI